MNQARLFEDTLMQNTEQRSSVLYQGSIRHHNVDKLGHPRCTFTLLCFQWYEMRVCCMVTFITHPLSGHLFNARLQMSGSIPAFRGKGCRLLNSTGLNCRHSVTFTWFICTGQPTQKANKHMIAQTYTCAGQFPNNVDTVSRTGVCYKDSLKHWRSPVCAYAHTNTQFATRFKSCFATAPSWNLRGAKVPNDWGKTKPHNGTSLIY